MLIQLKNGPGDAELIPALVKYLPVWEQLQVQNQRLVRFPPANSDAASAVQVVLPKKLMPGVLSMLHNTPTGGHLGIQKLQAKVKDLWGCKKNGVGNVMTVHLAMLQAKLLVLHSRCLKPIAHMSMWH